MKEIQYEIVKEIAVLSKGDSGYTKEINLISWNGREPKYDTAMFVSMALVFSVKSLFNIQP